MLPSPRDSTRSSGRTVWPEVKSPGVALPKVTVDDSATPGQPQECVAMTRIAMPLYKIAGPARSISISLDPRRRLRRNTSFDQPPTSRSYTLLPLPNPERPGEASFACQCGTTCGCRKLRFATIHDLPFLSSATSPAKLGGMITSGSFMGVRQPNPAYERALPELRASSVR